MLAASVSLALDAELPPSQVWRPIVVVSGEEEPSPQSRYETRRFSSDGVVIIHDAIASVYIGGTLIGAFDLDDVDRGPRNVLAVTLAR